MGLSLQELHLLPHRKSSLWAYYEQQACNEQKVGSFPHILGMAVVWVDGRVLLFGHTDFEMETDWRSCWSSLSKRNRFLLPPSLQLSFLEEGLEQMNRHLVVCQYRYRCRFPPYLVHLCSDFPLRIHLDKITELCLTVFYLYFIILYNTMGMSHLRVPLNHRHV